MALVENICVGVMSVGVHFSFGAYRNAVRAATTAVHYCSLLQQPWLPWLSRQVVDAPPPEKRATARQQPLLVSPAHRLFEGVVALL